MKVKIVFSCLLFLMVNSICFSTTKINYKIFLERCSNATESFIAVGKKINELKNDVRLFIPKGICIVEKQNFIKDWRKCSLHHILDISNEFSKVNITICQESKFEYNTKQAISWINGNELSKTNWSLSSTSNIGFSCPSSSKMDFEPNFKNENFVNVKCMNDIFDCYNMLRSKKKCLLPCDEGKNIDEKCKMLGRNFDLYNNSILEKADAGVTRSFTLQNITFYDRRIEKSRKLIYLIFERTNNLGNNRKITTSKDKLVYYISNVTYEEFAEKIQKKIKDGQLLN